MSKQLMTCIRKVLFYFQETCILNNSITFSSKSTVESCNLIGSSSSLNFPNSGHDHDYTHTARV